jgi:hypothetical protein
MTRFARLTSAIAIAALTIGILAGCGSMPTGSSTNAVATPEPAATTTPAPAATPSPAPVAAVAVLIEINSHSITVRDADAGVIRDIPYTTPLLTAVLQLQEAIGLTPTTAPGGDNQCVPAYTRYSWGELSLAPSASYYADQLDDAQWYVLVRAQQTPNGIRVESIGHQAVGAATEEVLAAYPGAATQSTGGPGSLSILVDPQNGGRWGTAVNVASGSLFAIAAPSPFLFGGDC